jgi:ABC-type polysaccharide/polyol phosphate export permease
VRAWGFGFHLPGALDHGIVFIWAFCLCFYFGDFGQYPYFVIWPKSRDHGMDVCGQLFMIICGIYYPVDILPKFFQYLAFMVPITHFLEFFRQSYGFKAHTPYPLLWGFA